MRKRIITKKSNSGKEIPRVVDHQLIIIIFFSKDSTKIRLNFKKPLKYFQILLLINLY